MEEPILSTHDVRLVDPSCVGEAIQMCQEVVLLDARSFVEYNTTHINGALNIGGNRSFRRKFSKNEVPIELFLQRLTEKDVDTLHRSAIVVYDQCLDDIKNLRPDCFLHTIISRILTKFNPIFVLRGGFLGFQAVYSELCWKNDKRLTGEDVAEYCPSDCDAERVLDACGNNPLRTCSSFISSCPESASTSSSDTWSTPAPSCLPSPQQSMTGSTLGCRTAERNPSYPISSLSPPADNSSSLSRTSLSSRPSSFCECPRPSPILPHLVLGSQSDAQSMTLCQQYGITHILNVSVDGPPPTHIQSTNFLRIPIHDNYTDCMVPYFDIAFQFIDKVKLVKGRVLIHCSAGISRSPTLAIAYLMHSCRISMRKAYSIVKSSRSTIAPNFNFLGQLLEYERALFASKAIPGSPQVSCLTKTESTMSQPCYLSPYDSNSSPSESKASASSDTRIFPRNPSITFAPVMSLSPKHSLSKKRDRPTCLSLDPSFASQSSLCSHKVFHTEKFLCSSLKSPSDLSPSEGKRSRISLAVPLNRHSSNLLPSPSTFFSKLELTSPSEDPRSFPRSTTHSSIVLPTTVDFTPTEKKSTLFQPSLTTGCSNSLDKLHFEFCSSPGKPQSPCATQNTTRHSVKPVGASLVRPTLLAERSLSSVFSSASVGHSSVPLPSLTTHSSIRDRSSDDTVQPFAHPMTSTSESANANTARTKHTHTTAFSLRLSCSTPSSLDFTRNLASPTGLRESVSLGADFMLTTVHSELCSPTSAAPGKLVRSPRLFPAVYESSCRQQQQQQMICKSSSSSSSSISSSSTGPSHNGSCFNLYSVS